MPKTKEELKVITQGVVYRTTMKAAGRIFHTPQNFISNSQWVRVLEKLAEAEAIINE